MTYLTGTFKGYFSETDPYSWDRLVKLLYIQAAGDLTKRCTATIQNEVEAKFKAMIEDVELRPSLNELDEKVGPGDDWEVLGGKKEKKAAPAPARSAPRSSAP